MKKIGKLNALKYLMLIIALMIFMVGCNSDKVDKNSDKDKENNTDRPDTWIADREIEGIIFQSAGDAGAEMNPDILNEIKERTGIRLKLTTVDADSSLQALTAGLAAGDLPDFISFYLNHSGRPEMQILLKGAREGQFVDVAPLFKETEVYSKYLDKDYLPIDTRENIMFRPEFDGGAYLVHMSIPRQSGIDAIGNHYVGGMYIRADIAEDIDFTTGDVKTSDELYELLKKIDAGNYVDNNDKAIDPLGPSLWGGRDTDYVYNDLVWSGVSSEKFLRDEQGNIKHEVQTEWPLKRVLHVQKLMDEGLMHKEFYTMEESRAAEGVVNGSYGIISDIHNYVQENQNMKYIPVGDLNEVTGQEYRMATKFKSGYAGWAIPSTTEDPEDVVKFADYLASHEGKLLYLYGIEGKHYELDESGNPVPLQELFDLKENDYAAAQKEGFRGVGGYWGEHLGWTDLDNKADFGEAQWGETLKDESDDVPQKLRDLYNYDEKLENALILRGMSPQSHVFEFDPDGDLDTALKDYDEDLKRAYYSKTKEEAEEILEASSKKLERAGLLEFIEFLEDKDKNDATDVDMNYPNE